MLLFRFSAARNSAPAPMRNAGQRPQLPVGSARSSAASYRRHAGRYDRYPAPPGCPRRAAARNSEQSRRRTARRRRRTNRRAAGRKSPSAARARHRAAGPHGLCRAGRAARRDGCAGCSRRGHGCRGRSRCRGRPAWGRAASGRRHSPSPRPGRGCRRRHTGRRPRSRRRP